MSEKIIGAKELYEKAAKKGTEPKLGYKFELFRVSSTTLNKFVFPENRRKLSRDQIGSLKKSLCNCQHFDSPIVVNEIDGYYRVIDGNHRIEAIKQTIKMYPHFKIDILLVIYKNLDADGEIQMFHRWNIGKKQSLDDFIQSVANKIPAIRWLQQGFPIKVSVYKQTDSVTVRIICGGYIAARNFDDQGYGLHRENFMRDLSDLGEKDVAWMKEYMARFKSVFGVPNPKNQYYKSTFFSAMMYKAYEYKEKDLTEMMRDKVLNNFNVLEYNKFSGREANRKMIEILTDLLRLKPRLNIS